MKAMCGWPDQESEIQRRKTVKGRTIEAICRERNPAKERAESPSLPEFQPGAAAQVKGLLGEGEQQRLGIKGKPSPGKSEVSQDEVIASYRRQAEAELNTERVPEALKETIKNYFLSLGELERK